jgi:hypothetical protein
MDYYSAMKDEIMLFISKWMVLEIIMLNEVNRFRKKKVTFSHICGS